MEPLYEKYIPGSAFFRLVVRIDGVLQAIMARSLPLKL